MSLPEASVIRHVRKLPRHSVWRITMDDLDSEQRYITQPAWTVFINALRPGRDTLMLSLERTSEYDAAQLDVLCDIVENVYPLRCFLEFEHHSWARAEQVLRGKRIPVVQHDAPELPGIIKDIHASGKHAILRLLGRDKRHWFEHLASERFAYRYTNAELAVIAQRIRTLRESSDTVTAILATHPAPSAMDNAVTLASILSK
ncbi:MAG: DUF72 domain-containing protein [Bacteroidota bacterium]|nr:DUF72 domain-containing protein [Bacteroidota bacterium]